MSDPASSSPWSISVECVDLGKPQGHSSTGIGYLDHMLDQFTSHAQIGLAVTVAADAASNNNNSAETNRNADLSDQSILLHAVGRAVGTEFAKLVAGRPTTSVTSSSTFLCPLDEALVCCQLETSGEKSSGTLTEFSLPPYGCFPKQGRVWIGKLRTAAIESFFAGLAATSGLNIGLTKLRGRNAHHVCESAFKAISRALRNLLDGVDCGEGGSEPKNNSNATATLAALYGPTSRNGTASLALKRTGTVERKTKETSITIDQLMDGGARGVQVSTGLPTLDRFWTLLAKEAHISLTVACQGDTWIDDHHTAEDVSIAIGQVWDKSLGSKAGLNRMWCARVAGIRVTMDLSNRPCCTHNLTLDNGVDELLTGPEDDGDLSIEMFEHVLESLIVNGRWTVHVEELEPAPSLQDMVDHVAQALGRALYYATAVDCRRAGATASSKGTLSV